MPLPNPYVGPRPFESGQPLFGRDREVAELCYLLTSERIVLLYSPSGAGKSSLVNAGLIPRLKRRFDIWGPTRVSTQPPNGVSNRHAWSAISGFAQTGAEPCMALVEYAQQRAAGRDNASPRNPLLIFDQFEEVLRVDPFDIEAKRAFFLQIGQLLVDDRFWALFIIREDYLAPLDPYANLIPTRFLNRYRIDRLTREMATQAILRPTEDSTRKYATGVAEMLVANLATVSQQPLFGPPREVVGEYVEPLQLQVVCFDVWERVNRDAQRGEKTLIEASDLGEIGNALRSYYDNAVSSVSGGNEQTEREIRQWFQNQLITPDGVRNQVRHEAALSGGLDTQLVLKLLDTYLVRAETHGGSTWYELAHDRLIEPVRASNEKWRDDHLSPFQRDAEQWVNLEKSPDRLLRGESLKDARKWAAGHQLNQDEIDYLKQSEAAARQASLLKGLTIAAFVLSAIAIAGIVGMYFGWQRAFRNADLAEAQRLAAVRQAKIAVGKGLATAALLNQRTPDLAALLALTAPQIDPEADSQSTLITVRHANPYLIAVLRTVGAVNAVAVSPDGKTIASVGSTPTISLWDVSTRQLSQQLAGPKSISLTVTFSPDGKLLACGSLNGEIGLWDLAGGTFFSLPHASGPVRRVTFSSDSRTLASIADDATTLWDTVSRKRIGANLASAGVDGAFLPDGKTLAILGGGISLINLATRQVTASAPLETGESAEVRLAISRDGKRAAESLGKGIVLRQLLRGPAFAPGNATPAMSHSQRVLGLAFSPNRDALASSSNDSTIYEWDLTGRDLPPILLQGHASAVNSLAYSPDGTMLVSGGDDGAIMLWDRRNPIGLGQYLHEAGPVQFASDGSAKASGKWPPPPPPCGERCDPATIVAASPDGTLTAGIDPEDPGIALVRRKGGGEPVQVGYPANITALAFHPSGKILAIGGADKKVLFQDPQSGKALTDQPALTVYQSTILSLAYSPDGNLLASADGDSELTDMSLDTDTNEHAVFIWDMRTHLLLGPPIRNFRDWYIQVKFSPDGQRLAAWSGDGSFILDLSPAKLMDSLCQLANRNLTVAEWRQYVGTLPYSKTCPAFPPGR